MTLALTIYTWSIAWAAVWGKINVYFLLTYVLFTYIYNVECENKHALLREAARGEAKEAMLFGRKFPTS